MFGIQPLASLPIATETGNLSFLGTNTLGTSNDSGNDNGYLCANSYTLSAQVLALSISVYNSTAAGNIQLGIYDNTGSGGGPGTLLASTPLTATTSGWQTIALSAATLIASGTIWIASYCDSGSELVAYNVSGTANNAWSPSGIYSALPGTYPSLTINTTHGYYSMFFDYLPLTAIGLSLPAATVTASLGALTPWAFSIAAATATGVARALSSFRFESIIQPATVTAVAQAPMGEMDVIPAKATASVGSITLNPAVTIAVASGTAVARALSSFQFENLIQPAIATAYADQGAAFIPWGRNIASATATGVASALSSFQFDAALQPATATAVIGFPAFGFGGILTPAVATSSVGSMALWQRNIAPAVATAALGSMTSFRFDNVIQPATATAYADQSNALTPLVQLGGQGAHRYWRFYITSDTNPNSATYSYFAELQFRTTVGGGQAATGGTASASSQYSTFAASNLFDGNLGTYWQSNAVLPQWIKYDLGAGNSQEFVEIAIYSWTDGLPGEPLGFQMQWSDDNKNWQSAWSATTAGWSASSWAVFTNPYYASFSATATGVARALSSFQFENVIQPATATATAGTPSIAKTIDHAWVTASAQSVVFSADKQVTINKATVTASVGSIALSLSLTALSATATAYADQSGLVTPSTSRAVAPAAVTASVGSVIPSIAKSTSATVTATAAQVNFLWALTATDIASADVSAISVPDFNQIDSLAATNIVSAGVATLGTPVLNQKDVLTANPIVSAGVSVLGAPVIAQVHFLSSSVPIESYPASLGTPFFAITYIKLGPLTAGGLEAYSTNEAGVLFSGQPLVLDRVAIAETASIYLGTAAGNVELSLYDDTGAGGAPGNLLAYANSTTAINGWNTLTFVTPVSLNPGTYYIMGAVDDNATSLYYQSTGGDYYTSEAYGAFPSTAPSMTFVSAGNPTPSMYFTLQIPITGEPILTELSFMDEPVIGQVHPLTAISISSVDVSIVDIPVLGQNDVLTSTSITTLSGSAGAPVFNQVDILSAITIASADVSTLGTPVLNQKDVLTAVAIESLAAILGTPVFVGVSGLGTATSIESGVSILGTPIFVGISGLVASSVDTGVSALGTPVIHQGDILSAITIASAGVASLGIPDFNQGDNLLALLIDSGVSVLGSPLFRAVSILTAPYDIVSAGVSISGIPLFNQMDILSAQSVVSGDVSTLEIPLFIQAHRLSAISVTTGISSSPKAVFSQSHNLAAIPVISAGIAPMGSPVMRQMQALLASSIVSGVSVLATPVFNTKDKLVAIVIESTGSVLGIPDIAVTSHLPNPIFISTRAAVFTPAVFHQTQVILANDVSSAGVSISGVPSFHQASHLHTASIVTGAAEIDQPIFEEIHGLHAVQIITVFPAISPVHITQVQFLSAANISTGPPSFLGTPVLTQRHALSAQSLETLESLFDSVSLYQTQILYPVSLATLVAGCSTPNLSQEHMLSPQDLISGVSIVSVAHLIEIVDGMLTVLVDSVEEGDSVRILSIDEIFGIM